MAGKPKMSKGKYEIHVYQQIYEKKVKGSNMGKENMSKGKYEIHVVQQIYGEKSERK